MNLTLTTDTPQSACVRLSGDLDFVSSPQLLDTVSELLADNGRLRHLHLDFGGVTFCDSAGLAALIVIERHTAEADVRLHLDHRPSQLDRILDVTGLLAHFTEPRPEVGQSSSEGTQDETVG
ncbi:STAS domain-containing protein [Mycolicibacterium aichiense]|uniref:Anti-sigma factor antagonist n=1 Tax=Mycolicibacterium aichiense TaxID=1799 RepID=A0AAD1HT59_9MYCO|nr:STAS domain-containing protein [Mycolicibacterium aichiense]MCV7017062.1 STAS domain-containing protein [Mycolicibacterium aichiense]BBX10511.1 anti-sigma factor antagonist [Mycolicibacterium aichiense]STZ25831.1 anti-sigma-factor antagonist [Mycolicibacterium aichiense]